MGFMSDKPGPVVVRHFFETGRPTAEAVSGSVGVFGGQLVVCWLRLSNLTDLRYRSKEALWFGEPQKLVQVESQDSRDLAI